MGGERGGEGREGGKGKGIVLPTSFFTI